MILTRFPSRRSVHLLASAALAALLALAPDDAIGLTVRPMTLTELTVSADAVFIGTATETRAERLVGGAIITQIQFRGVEWLKGANSSNTFVIEVAGGQVGDTIAYIPGAPTIFEGERYVIFLSSHLVSPFPITGGFQGILRVAQTGGTQYLENGHGDRVIRDVVTGRLAVLPRSAASLTASPGVGVRERLVDESAFTDPVLRLASSAPQTRREPELIFGQFQPIRPE